jgi:hypothetical protein
MIENYLFIEEYNKIRQAYNEQVGLNLSFICFFLNAQEVLILFF